LYHSVWPQQWAFFADESELAPTVAYRPTDRGLVAVGTQFSSAVNLGGLRRAADASYLAIGQLGLMLPSSAWHGCTEDSVSMCLNTAGVDAPVPLRADVAAQGLCGRLLLARLRPAGPADPDDRAVAIALVDVRCPA
jgi:hypothetical protein